MNNPPAGPSLRPSAPNPHIQARPPRPRRRTGLIVILIVVVLLGAIWWINHRKAGEMAGPGGPGGRGGGRGRFFANAPLPVTVKTVGKGDIHIYLNALGTVTAAHIATIRTQISGQLQEIAFQEGQLVHQGDLLAVIDPRPYENQLAQAQAQLLQAQSQLRTAEADYQRYETLAKEDSVAKQQLDTTRAQVNQAQGAVQAAQAAVATANLNLTYCHIKAPFDGRVGLRQVDTGNYITPGDANGIVVLTQTKPITVIFALPEDNMAPIAAQLRSGTKLPVDAFDRTDTKKIASGVLQSVDNQIDPTTGTFKLRAEFTNEDEALFPNQFVNVHLLLQTLQGVTVIPTSAVERGQEGSFVYIVTPEQTAAARNVTLGATEGETVAVQSGLAVGDGIVTDGADRLKDGQKVILDGQAGAGGGAPIGGQKGGAGWQKGGGGNWQKGGGAGKKWDGQRKKAGAESENKE